MFTFAYIQKSSENDLAHVWELIQQNRKYIYHFNGAKTEEVISDMLEHIAKNGRQKEDVLPYIKNLSRNIIKKKPKLSMQYTPFDTRTEDGEVSSVFLGLLEHIDHTQFMPNNELNRQLRALYLKYDEDFMGLKVIFDAKYDDVIPNYDSVKTSKRFLSFMHKTEERSRSTMYEDLRNIVDTFGAEHTFATLLILLKEVDVLSLPFTATVKEIALKPLSKLQRATAKIGMPIIKSSSGEEYTINLDTLTMDANPDYFNWSVVGNSKAIIKIDIAPFMEYLYDQLYVDQGVNTRLIKWCGDMYRITTPAGTRLLEEKIEYAIEFARTELVLSIVSANIGKLVAVSPDTIYIKATKEVFNKLKITTEVSKSIIVDVQKK